MTDGAATGRSAATGRAAAPRAAALESRGITAVVFDYGNTIIPYGREAVDRMNTALEEALVRHFGHTDRAALDRVRAADRMRPYHNDYVENDMVAMCRDLVRELHGVEAAPEVLADLLAARHESFVRTAWLPPGVKPVLERLAARRRLGVLSNYPDGNAVRDSMAALGIIELFDTVVVSGDLGVCKPDPRPFAAVTEELGVAPDRILFVGDNWLADIQGAKRYGMRAALTTEYAPAENFGPEPGDAEPDLTIASLAELERALA